MNRLLALSLIANAVLLLLTAGHGPPPTPMPRTVRGTVSAAPRAALTPSGHAVRADAPHPTPWAAIESADTAQWLANLRAIGCPESTIRDLVTFRVCRAFRNRGLAAETEAMQDWDPTRNRTWAEARASRSHQNQLRNEMIHELETLLDAPWNTLCEGLLGWKMSEGPAFLPSDQRHLVRVIEQRYREESEAVTRSAHITGLDPDERQQLRDLRQRKHSELAALLSPGDLQEYQARESEAARFVRHNLPGAKSETEFRAIVALAQQYDLTDQPTAMAFRYGLPGAEEDAEAQQDYNQRRAAFDAGLKEVLGEQRLAEQHADEEARAERERQREADRNELELRTMVESTAAEVGIAAADANRFVDHLKEQEATLSSRMDALEKTLTGTPEEKRKQMESFVKGELEKLAIDALGEKGRDFVRKMEEADQKRR